MSYDMKTLLVYITRRVEYSGNNINCRIAIYMCVNYESALHINQQLLTNSSHYYTTTTMIRSCSLSCCLKRRRGLGIINKKYTPPE